jgi:hypothetical protein
VIPQWHSLVAEAEAEAEPRRRRSCRAGAWGTLNVGGGAMAAELWRWIHGDGAVAAKPWRGRDGGGGAGPQRRGGAAEATEPGWRTPGAGEALSGGGGTVAAEP